MFNFIKKRMNKKGFTLVELLVVIAVLGIIAGIAIPRMSGVTDSFKLRADERTADNLARQVEIRVQIGTIAVPAASEGEQIVQFAAEKPTSGLWFGENFTESTQSIDNGIFVVTVNHDNIYVYGVAGGTTTTNSDTGETTTTSNSTTVPAATARLIDPIAHGGRIE